MYMCKTARVYHQRNVLYEIADRGLDFRVWYKGKEETMGKNIL